MGGKIATAFGFGQAWRMKMSWRWNQPVAFVGALATALLIGGWLRWYLLADQVFSDDEWHGLYYAIGKSPFWLLTHFSIPGATCIPLNFYTWLLGANNIFVTNPHVGKMPFDVFKDFSPVAQVATVPFVLVTHPSVTAKNVAGLVEYAKKNPGVLNYGSSGNGSPQQLATEMLNFSAGIQTQHVPYKGAVPAITDLLGGRIQIFIGAVNSLLPHIKEGKLKLLASAGSKRFAAFPELPAISETIPGVAVDVWLGVFMPAGVPKDIINKVSLDMAKVLLQNDVKFNLSNQGIEVSIASPEALTATIREDYARWGKVIVEANIKGE